MTPPAAAAAAPLRARPGVQPAPNRSTERRRHLRVVPDAPAAPSPAGRALTVLVVLVFVAFFGLVVFQALLVQAQNSLDSVNAGIEAQTSTHQDLALAVADAETPARITQAAEERLGMVFPTEVAFLEPTAADDAATRWDGVGPVSVTTGDATTAIDPATSDDDAADASTATTSVQEVPEGTAIDPATGLPAVGTDPATGAPVVVYDPATGLPITGYDANGRPITLQPGGGAGATSDSTGVEAGP